MLVLLYDNNMCWYEWCISLCMYVVNMIVLGTGVDGNICEGADVIGIIYVDAGVVCVDIVIT